MRGDTHGETQLRDQAEQYSLCYQTKVTSIPVFCFQNWLKHRFNLPLEQREELVILPHTFAQTSTLVAQGTEVAVTKTCSHLNFF